MFTGLSKLERELRLTGCVNAFESHREETQGQIERLEKIFGGAFRLLAFSLEPPRELSMIRTSDMRYRRCTFFDQNGEQPWLF